MFSILLGCFAEVGVFFVQNKWGNERAKNFFPIFNTGNIQRNAQYINGVFECSQKMPVKLLNNSQSFYCSFTSSNEISCPLTVQKLFSAIWTSPPMDKMKLIWLYRRHCFLPVTMCSYLLSSLTPPTAQGQWLLGAFSKQSKHHVRSLYFNSNTAPQLTTSYNKWSSNVS